MVLTVAPAVLAAQIAAAPLMGFLFGTAYTIGSRFGYEVAYPALTKGGQKQVESEINKMRPTFTALGGLAALDFGIDKYNKKDLEHHTQVAGLYSGYVPPPQGGSGEVVNPVDLGWQTAFGELSGSGPEIGSKEGLIQAMFSGDLQQQIEALPQKGGGYIKGKWFDNPLYSLIDLSQKIETGTTPTTIINKTDKFANFEKRAITSANNPVIKKLVTKGPTKGNLRNYDKAAEKASQKKQIITRQGALKQLIKTLEDRLRLMRASGANALDRMQNPNASASQKVSAKTSYAATLKGIGLTKKQLTGAKKDLNDTITQLKNY